MLGRRDPEHYGTFTLAELQLWVKRFARELRLEPSFFQTNHEGQFVEFLHRLPDLADAVAEEGLDQLIVGDLVNPGDSGREAQADVFWLCGFTGTSALCLLGP